MNVGENRHALLALVEDDLQRQRAALLAAADAQAAALRAQAHAEARTRVRAALAAARERRDAARSAAEARRQTRQRLARQGRASAALAAAWAELPRELEQRWLDPHARAAWIGHVVARAARELTGRGTWHLRHATGAGAADVAAAAASAPATVACVADPALRAGLRIACGGNVLDASLDGLLADRDAVAAALLRAMQTPP